MSASHLPSTDSTVPESRVPHEAPLGRAMGHLLIVSLLDYTAEPNGRIHHIIRHARKWWDRVTVLHGVHPVHAGLGPTLRAMCRFSVRVYTERNMKDIAVVPLFNTPEHLAKRLVGYPESSDRLWPQVQRAIEKMLSTFGIARDLSVIGSLFSALLLHARGPFDGCIVQCPLSGIVGLLARRFGLVRCVLYDDIDYAPGACDHRPRRTWIRQLERLAMRGADVIISVGSHLGELRAAQVGRPVSVIPNGVDLPLFRSGREKVPHPPTLVYTGRVVSWAGLEVGFAALAKARCEVPGLRFLVIGRSDPSYERRLRQHAERLGVAQAIQWVGEVPYNELPYYLRSADIGYAAFRPTPMKRYAFPLKVIEYMAAGLPVIGTLGTETERILKCHRCGETVAHEPEAIAQALIRLFHDRERSASLARNAADASETYGWENLMAKFDRTVCSMLNGRV